MADTQRSAFSLVETLAVLIIISLLSSVALPRYAQFTSNQKAEAAARRIVVDLAYAKRLANSSSASQAVVFDLVTHSYTLPQATNPDHPGQTYRVQLGLEPYNARLVSASFGGNATLIYDGYGAPDSGGSLVVAVGAYQKTITISAKNGKPEISR